MSIIIVYVDDFLGVHREDYDIDEVTKAFRWGVLHSFEVDRTVTFKGKQLTLRQKETGRIYLHVCQREFIEPYQGVGPGPKG